MSLFLGNLSPHIRRDELERVFRRFGRNNVQLKDGYGFVVYDVAANAERALRALQGKLICGEHISLTWSNKQPRPFQRFARSTRFHQPNRGRNFRREDDNGGRNRSSQDQRKVTIGAKHSNRTHVGSHTDDLIGKETGYGSEDIEDCRGEEAPILKDGLLDEGGTVEPNPVENSRWGEHVSDSLNDDAVENGSEFERYEPYHGHGKRHENENHQMTGSYGSPARGSSLERARRQRYGDLTGKHLDNPIPQQRCFSCGLFGHVMRNCPKREKFNRFGRRQDDESNLRGRGEGGFKRLGPVSSQRPNAIRDHLLMRRHPKLSSSGKRKGENLLESKETRHRSQLRRDSQGKKRREHGSPKKSHKKKARNSGSLPLDSDSNSSDSHAHSLSSNSLSGNSSHSHLRSVSSRSRRSVSSSSSSSSPSYSRSQSSRSRSRSRSRSGSLRLSSISIGLKSPSSPNKEIIAASTSPKADSKHATSLISENLLLEQSNSEGDTRPEKMEPKGINMTLNDGNAFSSFDSKDSVYTEHHLGRDNNGENHSVTWIKYEEKNLCMVPSESAFTGDNSLLDNFRETSDLQICKPVVVDQANNSKSISSREMCVVLKQHGLVGPEESEMQLSVESYFGAGRMWPWEMIYHRRLKKGLISIENYARRIAQNSEFGIVDKYIRSSSGWGEGNWNDS
ncbi:uncharacterized protein LOC143881880 [Tasmannia lanceolata]|uniref:uncharacterized protein LOC143881880 n=1 Tax=Tasmannia lanceolata TaxID=3420 RepID=UPI0040647188